MQYVYIGIDAALWYTLFGGDHMGRPTSDAQRKAVLAYQQRQDSITLRPTKDDGAQIRAAAAAAGLSMQAWILRACADQMAREGFTPPSATTAGDATP